MKKLFLLICLCMLILFGFNKSVSFASDDNNTASPISNLNEPGSILTFPLIDNINYKTIVVNNAVNSVNTSAPSVASADPLFAVGEINNIFFNNVENWVDVDQSNDVSVGDYFYGILHAQNIDGVVSGTIWGEDNVEPGLDTFTGYFLTSVTAISLHGAQPHITLSAYTGGTDPNGVLTNAEIANGVVLKMWTDSSTRWTDFINIATDIANSTDTTPWATFTTNGGYWYTHAPLIPPTGAGNTVGESFIGLRIVDNFTGLNFNLVNDTNETEINADVNFSGQAEIEVGDNHWQFQSNDPVFLFPAEEYCGDGIVGNTPGETCDPPGSTPDPSYPNNTCRNSCTYCGDGLVNNGEVCDFNDPNAPANCNTSCTLTPPECGDSILQPGETCDPPGSTPDPSYPNNTCRNSCTYCGDGLVNNGEVCDFNDPNAPANCNTSCTLTPICGDGIVGNTPGETCDPPGSNQGQPNECRANCTYCGDSHLDTSEQCDDGNNVNGDGCSAVCKFENNNYKTIINIVNLASTSVVLECQTVTHNGTVGGEGKPKMDQKSDFLIKLTPKEKFWWDTSTDYNRVNADGNLVSISNLNNRKGYMFCFAVDNAFTRLEVSFNYLKGDATIYGGGKAFNYNAIPSQGLAVVGDRVLNKDGAEYTQSTSRIMFEGFTSGTFGLTGTLAVANLGIDYLLSKQPEFDINYNCYNENEVWRSRHTHFKDFEQYSLSNVTGINLKSTTGKVFQCTADGSGNALEAVFFQTASTMAFGGNVWQDPNYGVPTITILPPVSN